MSKRQRSTGALVLGIALAVAMPLAACKPASTQAHSQSETPNRAAAQADGNRNIAVLPGSSADARDRSIDGSGAPADGGVPGGGSPAAPASAIRLLVRYGGTGYHYATTGKVDLAGLYPEYAGVWGLLAKSQSGTRPLYGCLHNSSDQFVSLLSSCEGHTLLRTEGYIYTSPPPVPNVALYRCNVVQRGDHYISADKNCENASGARNEGQLGYALKTSKVAFSRFKTSQDHWSTSGKVPSTYRIEGLPLFLESWKKPGTVPIYGCSIATPNGADQFVSRSANCEGKTVLRTEGYAYNSPTGSFGTPLYRCRWDAAHDHFLSARKDCENASGVVNEGLIGYAAAA